MKILIAGGSGFIGRALADSLLADQHQVFILTRRAPRSIHEIQWDGRTPKGWGQRVHEMDGIVNLTGFGLAHWPWTKSNRQRFIDSRVLPGLALAAAVKQAPPRPGVFIQASGINYYGLRGDPIADESTPPADDFLSQLTVQWEEATKSVEQMGVRRVVLRQAVVLARNGGMFPLMALPVRLFAGGPVGNGGQAVPWIHIADLVGAIRFLMEHQNANGAYNLIAPTPTSNAEFMRAVAQALHRPYWFRTPAFVLRAVLGEMSVLVAEGRYCRSRRLAELGYPFRFPRIQDALADLFS
ncbi:MAG TPA: TIGR01777 family oxidoreductase [Anaerolineales bacterium]|nr:TIGR01777 family oxidoreductase [Anaerolineales bacterium]